MRSNHSTGLLPVFSLLLAATLWGVIWYPLRLLAEHGLDGVWTTLVMYAAATFAGLVYAIGSLSVCRRRPWLLLALALAAGWTNLAFILAVIEGHVVRVLLLFYLSPLWTVALGWWLLREHLTRLTALTVLFAMGGAGLMLWDPALGVPWPQDRADWLAVSAGFAFALSNVLVRKGYDVPVQAKVIVTWIGVSLTAAAAIAFGGLPRPEVATGVVLAAIALGLFGIIIMTVSVQYGVTHMPVQRSAVILLFELIAGAVSAQLLTDEVVLPREWVGGAMIMLAAYVAARAGTEPPPLHESRAEPWP